MKSREGAGMNGLRERAEGTKRRGETTLKLYKACEDDFSSIAV
jgi:hypothetical protein